MASFLFRQKHGKQDWNGILLPKLFWPTVRKKCSKGGFKSGETGDFFSLPE